MKLYFGWPMMLSQVSLQLNTDNWIWQCIAMDEQRDLCSQGAALLMRMLLLGFAVKEAGCSLTSPIAG